MTVQDEIDPTKDVPQDQNDTDFIDENGTKIIKNEKVFYNSAQKINRDISILIIDEFIKQMNSKTKKDKNKKYFVTLFEAMSATGLRGIRYKKEITNDFLLFMNDLDTNAIQSIKNNFKFNELQGIENSSDSKAREELEKNKNETLKIKEVSDLKFINLLDTLRNVDENISKDDENDSGTTDLSKKNESGIKDLYKNECKTKDFTKNDFSIKDLSKNECKTKDLSKENEFKTKDLSKNDDLDDYLHQNINSHFSFLTNQNCNTVMSLNPQFFNIIDIDPFGSFVQQLPFAFTSIKHDGLLCLTATDTAVLNRNRNKCKVKYDVLIEPTPFYNEMGLRAALSTIARIAALYEIGIEPVLSLSVDFYIRLFVKVKRNLTEAKRSRNQLKYFYTCKCGYFRELNDTKKNEKNKFKENNQKDKLRETNEQENCDENKNEEKDLKNISNNNENNTYDKNNENNDLKYNTDKNNQNKDNIENNNLKNNKNEKCPICTKNLTLCGPLWTGKLHNQSFLSSIPSTLPCPRVTSYLKMIRQETGQLFYISIPKLCSNLKLDCIPMVRLCSALLERGHSVCFTHCTENAIKTDCTVSEVAQIIQKYFSDTKMNRESIQIRNDAVTMCKEKYNRTLMNQNGGPGSRYKS